MFPIEETDDILLEDYEDEISDSLPDITRARASVHRGAAYLQEDDYPPGGASEGQERAFDIVTEGHDEEPPTEEVMGAADDEAYIFGSYGLGCDVLGATGTVTRRAGSVAPVSTSRVSSALQQAGAGSSAARKLSAVANKMTTAKVAVPQRAGIVLKKTPGGRKITSLKLNNAARGANRWDPKVAIKNAKDAAKRAINVGNKLKSAARTLAKKSATKVHGAVAARPGARPPVRKGPRVRVTPAQLTRLADKAIKAGKALQKQTSQFEKIASSNASRIKAGVARARMLTKMRGEDDDALLHELYADHVTQLSEEILTGAADIAMDEAVEEILGQVVPGYTGPVDESGSPLPTGGVDPTDPYADPAAAGGVDPYAPPDPTYGLGPPPTEAPPLQEGVDYVRDPGPSTDRAVYSSDPSYPGTPLPVGAIIYDGSQPFPWQGVGSFTRFYGGAPEENGGGNSGYQWGGGNPTIMDGWYLWWGSAYHDNVQIDLRYKKEGEGDHKIIGTGRERSEDSVRRGWGPLIGNPKSTTSASGKPWTWGLRYDAGGNQWFWYYDQAPDWAKRPIEMQRLNQAVLEYKAALTAAQAEAAAQALADQAEQKEYEQQLKQQAREDAEYQRQMERETAYAEQQAALQALEQERYDQAMAAQQERDLAADERRAQFEEDSALRLLQAQEEAEMRRLDHLAELAAAGVPVDASAEAEPADDSAVEEYSAFDEEVVDLPSALEETVDEVALAEDEVLGSLTPGTLRGSDRIRYYRDVRRGNRESDLF